MTENFFSNGSFFIKKVDHVMKKQKNPLREKRTEATEKQQNTEQLLSGVLLFVLVLCLILESKQLLKAIWFLNIHSNRYKII